VIRPEYAEDAQFRRRFEREAEALARVQGGQTAVLLGRGFDQELLWMATEYIPGLSLSATVADHGTLDLAAAWRLAADLGRAVGAMERADVVHRDIKPSNVILGPDGCRLIDFGISQAGDTSSITVTGQQVGTPAYMSPEQVRGTAVATSSDIFALGSVLAYALTGNAPFGDGTSVDVLHRVAFDPPREDVLERVAVADRELAQLVRACLAKEPQQRPTPEAVVATAATRQAAAPWSAVLHESIMTRIQVAAAVTELPLDSAPVQETLILSRRDPAEDAGGLAVAAVAAEAAPGPSPFASPFAHPHQPQQPQHQAQQLNQSQPPQQHRRLPALDPGQRLGLALEPAAELGVLGVLGPDHLDGGEPGAAVPVPAQIDPAHTAAAEQRHDPERPDLLGVGAPERGRTQPVQARAGEDTRVGQGMALL
jgi:serine/threonine protein kinase